ncbi:hypothetical protein GKQ23_17880 [Erwinia sp. E602]|uniref:hypothetical protein n=1 Tax=Erwinia sp. E602 TaxID=2675378 RepID=UPI001BA4ED29|nr:hypothetical protein [Erwinia sp. E602]QUG76743.1 hypothetical protein GKQ23_17880 [Erwinia sp. E602]
MTNHLPDELSADWQHAVRQAAGNLPEPARLASLAAFLAESASLAPQLMLHALQRSGFTDPASWQIASRCRELRLDACFTPLLERWHLQLWEEGWLENADEGWRLAGHAPDLGALEQRTDDARHRLRQLMGWLEQGHTLAAALFSTPEQLEDWLAAPVLLPSTVPGLHQLLHQPGIIDDYFSGILAEIVPLLLAEQGSDAPLLIGCRHTLAFRRGLPPGAPPSVVIDLQQPLAAQLAAGERYTALLTSGLFSHRAPQQLLGELHGWLQPGAPLLLENSAERPLHWVTPAALRAHAVGDSDCPFSAAADEARCRQQLEQAGYQLLAVWPQPATAMAFCGQRLLLARVARG